MTQQLGIQEILVQRGARYGKFENHANVTQALKDVADHFLCNILGEPDKLSAPQQEALDMIFHKIGRILNGDPNYVDSWTDIAGYATLIINQLDGEAL
jgi:hypothetical protein